MLRLNAFVIPEHREGFCVSAQRTLGKQTLNVAYKSYVIKESSACNVRTVLGFDAINFTIIAISRVCILFEKSHLEFRGLNDSLDFREFL